MATKTPKTASPEEVTPEVFKEPSIDAIQNAEKQGKKTEQKIRSLTEKYKSQPKKKVSVSPMYKPYFSNGVHVSINTKVISIPCDGKPYEIPEVFADRVHQMIHDVDTFILRKGRMEQVSTNIESSPGELTFY